VTAGSPQLRAASLCVARCQRETRDAQPRRSSLMGEDRTRHVGRGGTRICRLLLGATPGRASIMVRASLGRPRLLVALC
jgi:hypothetical protein